MIRLLSTDFDGTLVDHYGLPAVAPELFELLALLQREGVQWAINTGRELEHIIEGLQEFAFPVKPDYVLTAEREVFHRGPNGVWQDFGDWNQRCHVAHHELFQMAEPLLRDVRHFLEHEAEAHPIFEGDRLIGLTAASEEEMDRICLFLDRERVRVPGFQYMRNSVYARFCHEDYSKGTALSELARLLGIGREEIFAAGDHFNDLPMLDGRHARWVACPANGVPEVQKAVREAGGYVAAGVCSLGVVEALRHFRAAEGPAAP